MVSKLRLLRCRYLSLELILKKTEENTHLLSFFFILFALPLFFAPFFSFSFTQGKEMFLKFGIFLTFLVLSIQYLFGGSCSIRNILKSWIFLLLLFQITLYALTNALSPTPTVALYGTLSRGFGFIMELFLLSFTLYGALTLSEHMIAKILKALFASGMLVALYAVMQRAGFDPFFAHYDTGIFSGRVFSFLGNPSYLGQFMLLIALLGGYFMLTVQSKKWKFFYALGVTLSVAVIFLSGTRTALIGLLFALILTAFKYRKSIVRTIQNHKKTFLICVMIGVAGVISFSALQERFSLSDTAFRSLYSRLEIWKGAAHLIERKPILGYGGETFSIYFPEIITKKFLSLEENISINADRIHNETLEIFFSHGIFGLLLYITLFISLLRLFLRTHDPKVAILSIIIVANAAQNQFAFPDITISAVIAFCFAGLIALQSKEEKNFTLSLAPWKYKILASLFLVLCAIVGFFAVLRPAMSQLTHMSSKAHYSVDYDTAIHKHKKALSYTPYYSELWFELMFIDRSSMARALYNLEQIHGNSGDVLAWKGNFYAKSDPHLASTYYTRALEKNPYHPNWIRSFADMLYLHQDYKNALYLYYQYLQAIPDVDMIQQSSRAFLKDTPYFWEVIKKIETLTRILDE